MKNGEKGAVRIIRVKENNQIAGIVERSRLKKLVLRKCIKEYKKKNPRTPSKVNEEINSMDTCRIEKLDLIFSLE